MRKKNDLCLAVITGVFLLSACANETDIVNLGGTTGSAEVSSDGVQSSSSGKGKSNIEDYFIDNAKYDHLSADEYRLHLKDGRRSITAVKENFAADTSYLIANSQNCFTFKDCEIIPFPDVDDVQAVTFREHNLTCDEAFDIIRYWLEKWGISDKVDLDASVRDSKTPSGDPDPEKAYMLARDVWDKNDGAGFMFLNTELGYVQMSGSGVGILSHGVITDYYAKQNGQAEGSISRTLDPYDVFGETVKSGSLKDLEDSSYVLLDGSEISVGDGVKVFDDFYSFAKDLDYEIYSVDVLKIVDRFVYKYNTRRVYRGVPIAIVHRGHTKDYVHSYRLTGDGGSIYVASPEELCAYYGFAGKPVIEPLCSPQTEIIDIKDAMETVYGIMSDDYQCNIDRIEFCMGYYQAIDTEDNGRYFLTPCWEFSGHSDVSGYDISIFVDALTGELGFKEYRRDVVEGK